MPLAELNELDRIQNYKGTSNDGKFLAPAIANVFAELKSNLDDVFSSLESRLLNITKEQDVKINKLQDENKTLKQRILKLEEKSDADDAYERKDSVIISGSKVGAYHQNEDTAKHVIQLLKNHLNVVLQPTEISILHRLQEKKNRASGSLDIRDIYIKFCRRSVKKDIVEAARAKKVDGFYVNEALTPPRQTIAYVLRQAKRKCPNIVSGSASIDGKPYVWIHPPNPNARGAKCVKHCVHTYGRLLQFCNETLKKPLQDFIKSWDH